MTAGLGIRVEALHKSFVRKGQDDLRVLTGVDFSVAAGSFVSLLGPSGSGKSVTLHIVGGLMDPTTGRVRFVTEDGEERARADVRLGFVFQNARLLPWLTVERNIRFVLEHELPESEIEPRVRDVLELMGLRDFANYYPHQISGGMQQRVAIARALAFRPDVILMDEPFSHLDEITARLMRAEMVSLWRRMRTTILFVTHDLAEACYLSEQVVLLTPKPTTVHARVPVELPFPRAYGSDAMFDAERNVLRLFEEAIGGSLNARQRAALEGQFTTPENS